MWSGPNIMWSGPDICGLDQIRIYLKKNKSFSMSVVGHGMCPIVAFPISFFLPLFKVSHLLLIM